MDNWEKIIEKCSKKQDNQTMKLITATVTSVTDNFYRADVRLITGQEIPNLINQTPNKLHVGQGVTVGYMTVPQAGWIQIAHGEPDPMRQGGGWEVDSAAIVTTNISDFIINQELMMTITPETRLYYGGMPQFVVVQGHYCLASGRSVRSRITYDTATGKWLIDNNADLYDAIIANRDKFGSQLGTADNGGIVYGTLLTSADGVHKYPQSYRACIPVFTRIERGSSGWRTDISYEHWDATNNDPLADWYGNLTHPTATNGGSYTTARVSPKTPTNGNNDTWLSPISDFFIVPVLYNINTTGVAGRDYGNVMFDEFLLFATAEGYNGQYSVTGLSNNGSTSNAPLISAAELAFLQGLYQRSEPQEVTP